MPGRSPRTRPRRLFSALPLLALAVSNASAATFLVHSAAEITAAQASAKPGDTLLMADGLWTNQNITFSDNGTAAAPITLRAQTPGRVILTGSSRLTISGDYLVADGLEFKDGALTGGQVVSISSSAAHSRLTNSAIINYNPTDINVSYGEVRVDGVQNRVDHCFFSGMNHAGVELEVFPSVNSQHQVDHNQFVDHKHGNSNGWETIRVGLSSVQTRSAKALIENNLFERADGELEIISIKSSDNIIRNNTFRASDGTLTLRHGSGSTVEGNFFLGENKAGSGGVRVIGPNQTVQNNYFQDLDTNAISLTTGYSNWDVNTTATGYEPVTNAKILNNTFVNISDQVITRDAGFTSDPSSTRNVRPATVTIANNILWSTSETLIQGTEGANWTWAGNIAYGANVGKSGPGIRNTNPLLVKDASGLWRPAANSPAINAAASGPWTPPATDMDGQPRTAPLDIGADERLPGLPVTSHPLSASDVGPSWLNRRTMPDGTFSTPVLLIEAENYTALRDPNNDGKTWSTLTSPTASGGKILKAPAGAPTSLPSQPQDTVVEYDVAFHDAGTYWLYILCRAPDSVSNSFYIPSSLGADPTLSQSIPANGQWTWLEAGAYTITAAQQNRPFTLGIGRQEGNLELDRLLFSPVRLDLAPEPASAAILASAAALLIRRRRLR